MLTRRLKLGSVLLVLIYALGLFAFPTATSAETVYQNAVPNPGFEEDSPVPVAGSNIQDAGIVENDIRLNQKAFGVSQTDDRFLREYTYDSTYAYKAKFMGTDGARFGTAGTTEKADRWLPLTNGNYIEIPLPGMTIVPGTKYGVSFRALHDSRAGESSSTNVQMRVRLNWNTDPSLGENVAFKGASFHNMNQDYGWKMPGLVTGSSQIVIGTNSSAVVNDTTKMQIFFSVINRTQNGNGEWGEHSGATRTLLFDDFYVAPISTAAGVDIMPAVVSSTPADGAALTSPVEKVTVNFNYKIDMTTLIPDNMVVTGAEIDRVVMAPDAMSADIFFTEPVSEGTVSLQLTNKINDVFSTSRVLTPQTITFTLGQAPPVLLNAVPANGATDVLSNTNVRLTFSKALDPNTVNKTNITTPDAVIDTVSLENEGKDIVITFAGTLASEKLHTITLANIAAADGSVIEEPIVYTFTTASSGRIIATTPANGEKRVYTQPVINIKASKPLAADTWKGKVLINGTSTYAREIKADPNDASIFGIVTELLDPFTTYTVEIGDLIAQDGAVIPGTKFSFTTGDKTTNKFSNPGFENATYKFDTMKNANGIISDDPHSGFYHLKNTAAGGEDWINIRGGLQVGKKYGYSMYFKLAPDNPSNTGSFNFTARAVYTLGGSSVHTGDVTQKNVSLTKGNDYIRLTGIYTFPAHSDSGAVPANIIFKLATGVRFYWDDCEIYELPDLDVTDSGTIYNNAVLAKPSDDLVVAFSREMAQNLAGSAIKIDGVQVAAVAPSPYSNRQFILTPAAALAPGSHTVEITGAQDIYGEAYTGSFSFTVSNDIRYYLNSFKVFANDAETDKLVPQSTMKASVSGLSNYTGAEGKPSLIVALFKDGEMVDYDFAVVTLAAGATAPGNLEASIDVPNLADGEYTFKAMLWENVTHLTQIRTITLGE